LPSSETALWHHGIVDIHLKARSAVILEIKPETERLAQEELRNGHFRSIDEMIVEGVSARREGKQISSQALVRTRAEAAARIRSMRRGNRLPEGTTIQQLINEGRP